MIAIGSDHGGYALKLVIMKHLEERGLEYRDFGTYNEESCDYPDYGEAVARAVASGEYERGILICGTGIGISISANKVHGIRAALWTAFPRRWPAGITTRTSWPWASGRSAPALQ